MGRSSRRRNPITLHIVAASKVLLMHMPMCSCRRGCIRFSYRLITALNCDQVSYSAPSNVRNTPADNRQHDGEFKLHSLPSFRRMQAARLCRIADLSWRTVRRVVEALVRVRTMRASHTLPVRCDLCKQHQPCCFKPRQLECLDIVARPMGWHSHTPTMRSSGTMIASGCRGRKWQARNLHSSDGRNTCDVHANPGANASFVGAMAAPCNGAAARRSDGNGWFCILR